jgi:DNA-directed RNA polymerase subunit RPC12/RpoP
VENKNEKDFSKELKKIKFVNICVYFVLFVFLTYLILTITILPKGNFFIHVLNYFGGGLVVLCAIAKVGIRCPRCNDSYFYKTPIMSSNQKGSENQCKNCGLKIK